MSELVQDFHDDEQVFRVGCKPLNSKSVEAAHGNRDRVVPIAAAHLTREIPQDFCRSDGRIDPRRSALNYSMLADVPMDAAAIKARAIALMEQHGIKWRSLRRDKIMATETIISLPPGFAGDVDAFLADSLYFAEHIAFGHQVPIIAAVVHADEGVVPHLHVLALPLTLDGRMDGHDLVGYTGMHQKRNDLFYQHVGKRYGLERPTRKATLCHADRVYLADCVLAKLVADCPTWASNPAAMKEIRRLVLADPLGMAKAHGIALPHNDQADHQEAGTAYMRLSHDDADLPAVETNRMPVSAVAAGMEPDGGPDAAGGDDQDADIELAKGADALAVPATDPGQDASAQLLTILSKAADAPTPQPAMPVPSRIDIRAANIDQDTGTPPLTILSKAGDESINTRKKIDDNLLPIFAKSEHAPPERLTRVRDADLPADRWDGDQGEHVPLPPPPPSKRAQTLLGVRASMAAMRRAQDARRPQIAALLDPAHHRAGSDAAGRR